MVIGHGAPWLEREDLISYFRELLPATPIIALLRSTDAPFSGVDFNCPTDNPPLWERTILQALAKWRDAVFTRDASCLTSLIWR